MSKSSSMQRVSIIVKRLNDGDRLRLSSLASEFETSDRTIRRDIELIKNVYGDFLIHDQGVIYAIKNDLLNDVLSPDQLSILKGVLKLGELGGLSLTKKMKKKEREKLTGKISDYEKLYIFKTRPFEEFHTQPELFTLLEKAIRDYKVIELDYDIEGNKSHPIAKPYAIVFLNENFYLASESFHDNTVKLMLSRVTYIKNIEYTGKTFRPDPLFSKFVKSFQTTWARYNPISDGTFKTINVELEVDENVSRFFKLKKFLPSQKILETNEKGDIRVSFTVTSVGEMIPLCRQWLPHIRVVNPIELREKLLREAQRAVKNLDLVL